MARIVGRLQCAQSDESGFKMAQCFSKIMYEVKQTNENIETRTIPGSLAAYQCALDECYEVSQTVSLSWPLAIALLFSS